MLVGRRKIQGERTNGTLRLLQVQSVRSHKHSQVRYDSESYWNALLTLIKIKLVSGGWFWSSYVFKSRQKVVGALDSTERRCWRQDEAAGTRTARTDWRQRTVKVCCCWMDLLMPPDSDSRKWVSMHERSEWQDGMRNKEKSSWLNFLREKRLCRLKQFTDLTLIPGFAALFWCSRHDNRNKKK